MATTTSPKTTVLADDTTVAKPQTTSAGDAPADTFDKAERVSSVTPDKKAAAEAGFQSVNAVAKSALVYTTDAPGPARTETVYAYDETGKQITLTHNLVTGETTPSA